MRHTIHQIREGVAFHLFTTSNLEEEPRGQLVAALGKARSWKDKDKAMAILRRCCAVRESLLNLERG